MFYTLFIQGNFSKFHGFDKHEWLISSKVLNLFILPTKAATIFTVTLILRELKDRYWELRKSSHYRGNTKTHQIIKSNMAKSNILISQFWIISISYKLTFKWNWIILDMNSFPMRNSIISWWKSFWCLEPKYVLVTHERTTD